MPEVNTIDREANSTSKHSGGFWAAVIVQWFYAIVAGALALLTVMGVIVQVLKGGEILMFLVVLPHLAFFSWTAWLSGKLAWNIQSGTQSPSASFSLNWGSALTLTIVTTIIGGLAYIAIMQRVVVMERARVSEVVSFIDDIDSRQKAFSAKHGRLPATTSEIGPMPPLRYFTLDYVIFWVLTTVRLVEAKITTGE